MPARTMASKMRWVWALWLTGLIGLAAVNAEASLTGSLDQLLPRTAPKQHTYRAPTYKSPKPTPTHTEQEGGTHTAPVETETETGTRAGVSAHPVIVTSRKTTTKSTKSTRTSTATVGPSPIQVVNSPNTYGPDGPWNAFRVWVGSEQQPIDLFTGAGVATTFLGDGYCDNYKICLDAKKGGLFSDSSSSLDHSRNFTDRPDLKINYPVPDSGLSEYWHLDEIWLQQGHQEVTVQNATINKVLSGTSNYYNGLEIAYSLGLLSLGAPLPVQQDGLNFLTGPTSYLYQNKSIPSASFGLHIGSAKPFIPASLWYGGYDQLRVIGDPLVQPVEILKTNANSTDYWPLNLLDITIDTAAGESPFTGDNPITGLLVPGEGNTSLPVQLSPATPYLFLPSATCTAIASRLPVSFNSGLGLYEWNISDPVYSRIMSSASYMSFSIGGQEGSSSIEIKVPFQLLDLTLDFPLVNESQPYFPCYPYDGDGLTLGRAFLQSAFLGTNWAPNDTKPQFFLAQAPGPDLAGSKSSSDTKIVPIDSEKSVVSGRTDGMTWEDTWESYWKAAAAASSSSGLSAGDKAGIAVGTVFGVGLIAICLLGAILLRRRRRRRSRQPQELQGKEIKQELSDGSLKGPQPDAYIPVAEMGLSSESETKGGLDSRDREAELEAGQGREITTGPELTIDEPASNSHAATASEGAAKPDTALQPE